MNIEVRQESLAMLEEYASIPIAFEVRLILDIANPGDGLDEYVLTERSLDVPYIKDYDAIKGENPAEWAKRFDISNWGLFAAWVEGHRVGGAAVAFNSPELMMLENREDLAILWDIRVTPEARGQGVGSALFQAVEAWARTRGCRQIKIETQNINLPACRFYARQGCMLAAVHRFAYPDLTDEIQMLWCKDIL